MKPRYSNTVTTRTSINIEDPGDPIPDVNFFFFKSNPDNETAAVIGSYQVDDQEIVWRLELPRSVWEAVARKLLAEDTPS
jgi:hypothetical protein